MKIKKSKTRKIISIFWLYLFPLASFLFYEYVGFNEKQLKMIQFIIVFFALIFVLKDLLRKHKQTRYYNIVRILLLLFLFSMIMACLFWEQSIQLSYRATAPQSLTILYFFILFKIKPSRAEIERLIWFFCIVYLLCWVYGIAKAPQLVFGSEDEFGLSDERGVYRLFIKGRGFICLGLFLAVSKFIETKRKIWIFIFAGLFAVIVMHTIRQVIFFSFLVTVGYLLWSKKKLLIFVGILSIGFLFFENKIKISDNSIIGSLLALSERQIEEQYSGDENIRITAYKYLFTEYSANIITDVFGNGFPHEQSHFGQKELYMKNFLKIFSSDVGYAAIFVRVGWLGLLCYLLIFYRTIKQKVPPAFMYAKLFIIYMIFANIAASWVYHDMIAICVCLFILECSNLEQKNEQNEILDRNTGI